MSELFEDIYGQGWAFPVGFSPDGVKMASGLEDVRQGMAILFQTTPGERIMRPAFGCGLLPVLFENVDEKLTAEIVTIISDAVIRHEPRVALESVSVLQDEQAPERLRIECAYRPRGYDRREQVTLALDIQSGPGMDLQ